MAWGRVDDRLWGSPKWLSTPPGSRALWVTALSWCMDQLTDGRVPRAFLPMLGGRQRDAAGLVASGLWIETEDGWQFHDWLSYQPSRAEIERKQEQQRERKRRWAERQNDHDGTDEERSGNAFQNAFRNASGNASGNATPIPSHPIPSHPINSYSPLGGNSPKQGEGFDPQPCGRNHNPADACGACGTARKEARKAEEQATREKSARDRQAQERERARRKAEAESVEVDPEAGKKAIEKVRQALSGPGERES